MDLPDLDDIAGALLGLHGPVLLAVTADGEWRRVESRDTGENEVRELGVGSSVFRHVVAVRELVVAATGSFDDVVGERRVHRPPAAAPLLTRDVACTGAAHRNERIACRHCDGTGRVEGRNICRCVDTGRTVRNLGSDVPDAAHKSAFELDAGNPEDVAEAARRADAGCEMCSGAGVSGRWCYTCRGVGTFWGSVRVEIVGPVGVVDTEVCAKDFAPFVTQRQTRHGEVLDVDESGWFASLAAPACGTADMVVIDHRWGTATRLASTIGWSNSGSGALEEWFGERFVWNTRERPDMTWPPKQQPPAEFEQPVYATEVRPFEGSRGELERLLAAAGGSPVGFTNSFIATGETGPAITVFDDDFSQQRLLSTEYTLVDAVLGATYRLERSHDH